MTTRYFSFAGSCALANSSRVAYRTASSNGNAVGEGADVATAGVAMAVVATAAMGSGEEAGARKAPDAGIAVGAAGDRLAAGAGEAIGVAGARSVRISAAPSRPRAELSRAVAGEPPLG